MIDSHNRRQAETGSDIVTGTRYARGGGVFGWNFKRKLTSRGANYLAATLLQPGVRLSRRHAVPSYSCTGRSGLGSQSRV